MNAKKKIQHYLSGQLSTDERKAFEEEIAKDESLKATYDDHVQILRLIAEKEELAIEKESVWKKVEANLEPSLETKKVEKRGWRWSQAFAALAIVFLVALIAIISLQKRKKEELTIKGGSASLDKLINFEIYAIEKREQNFATPRRVNSSGILTENDYIQLRYLNHDPALKYLSYAALYQNGKFSIFYPRARKDSNISDLVKIRQTTEMQTVARSVKLEPHFGQMRLICIYSGEPISYDQFRHAVTLLKRGEKLTKQEFSSWRIIEKSYTLKRKGE